MVKKNINKELIRGFSVLTEENRENVIDMAKFLVHTQNTIIPEMLNPDKKTLQSEKQRGKRV